MIRAAFLALALTAGTALGQSTRPGSTKTAPPKPAKSPLARTTLSGVYTLDDAAVGKELYDGLCGSCHRTSNLHNTPEFRKKWTGKTLSDLFNYMRATMPKNDPASLADDDYAVILAYMLQMNHMPPGKTYLSTDTLELRKIRIDTVRASRKP